jgi:hypothetical protein
MDRSSSKETSVPCIKGTAGCKRVAGCACHYAVLFCPHACLSCSANNQSGSALSDFSKLHLSAPTIINIHCACFVLLCTVCALCLQVNKSLLAWYDRVQRVLPWRRNPHHKPQQNPAAAQPQHPSTAAAAAAAEDDGGSSSSKQKKPSKKQLAAAAEAEAVLAAARPAPAELAPQQFAYYVWVSEIMLQQTQVSRVVTYFNK